MGLATISALVLMGVFAGAAQASSVSGVTVNNSSPTAAVGARTVYFVKFTTSATGGLSRANNDSITVTFPSGTDITSALGNTSVVDVTNGNTAVGNCGKSGLVATCTLFTGASIAGGDQVSIEFDGVINPSTPSTTESVSVATTKDTTTVGSAVYSVVAGNQISQPTVSIASPTAAAGARTVYFVSFTTSATGGLSRQALSQITVTFPSGTDITSALGNTSVVDVTNGNTAVGNCGKSGLVATCTLFTGSSVAPGDQVSIEFDGVINPSPAGPQTLKVSTTSDTPQVTSATYNTIAGGQITQPTITISSPTAAAGARTVYFVNFSTSSTGALSRQALSQITVTFPSGTDITSALGNTSVVDVTTSTVVGNCGKSGLVATCTLFTGSSIAPGDQVSIEFDGVINPSPAGPQTLKVSTTSDTPQVTSASYSTVAGGQVTQPTVTLSNHAPSATGVRYDVAFATSSPTGGLSRQAVSQITVTFPSGTDITSGLGTTSVVDVTTSTAVGNCGKSGLVATCTLFTGTSIAPGHQVDIEFDKVVNPSSASSPTLKVSTTSDTPQVTSASYSIGGAPPSPSVTGVSPSSGSTTGGTSVTITGTDFTGATSVRFGATTSSFTVTDASHISATSPAHAAGTVDVTVTTPSGTSTTAAADHFTYTPPSGPPPPPSAPTVAPSAPASSGATAAAVSGTVNPKGEATTVVFQYGIDPSLRGPGASTALYDQSTSPQELPADASNHAVSANLTGLVPGALYHVRMVATNSAGTTNGPDQTFSTPKAAAPPPPVLGQTQNVAPVSGKTFILLNGKFVPLTSTTKIPSGATIDALRGTLTLTSATGVGKKTQTGTFGGAVFKVAQTKGGALKGLTTLTLVYNAFKGAPSLSACTTKHPGRATAARLSKRTLQLLHGKDRHGKFRSKGRYAAATTRGTAWSMADRCDGTLTSVTQGAVTVNDLVRHKNFVVRAGHSYLAKAHK